MLHNHRQTRRSFLKTASLAGVGFALSRQHVLSANDDIRVAVIGLGGKGGQHTEVFSSMPGVRLAALAEVDPKRLETHVEKIKAKGVKPLAVTDPRRIIERDDIDAVVIATPNHWHALLAVWAIRAGKHVYVEKPVSHNIWEGNRIVEEAKARGKIVQAGTQYRSCPGLREAVAWTQAGNIGKPRWAQVVWYEYRPAIGKCAPFTPDWLNYDLWCGPAPLEPLSRPKLHYDWHWAWSTGDGDLGNSGIHAFDACRMFLSGAVFPTRMIGVGGRFTYDDAAQTPNTQFSIADYAGMPVIIENRNLSMEKDDVVMDHFRRIREGFVIQYEGGYFAGLRTGGSIFDSTGKEVKKFQGDGGRGHTANFIKAVRSGRTEDLNAPVREGHVSSAVCHLGNFSYRMGQPASLKSCREALGNHPQVDEAFTRLVQSLEKVSIDLDKSRFVVGPKLQVEPQSGQITGVETGNQLEIAQKMARGAYRAPFEFPTKS